MAVVSTIEPEELIAPTQAAKMLHVRPATLTDWRLKKRGPRYLKVGRFVLRFPEPQARMNGHDRARQRQSKRARKPASVVPFPAARRTDLVQRIAARMAVLPLKSAEAHLLRQLEIQAETMRRRGIAERVIARENRALQTAVRVRLWRCVLLPEDTPPEIAYMPSFETAAQSLKVVPIIAPVLRGRGPAHRREKLLDSE
jgi:hypothetical protein